MLTLFLAAILGWTVGGAIWLWCRHGSELRAAWVEPMLGTPLLTLESDDWGPPGTTQGQALEALAGVLERYRDGHGRPACMTLGMILAAPRAGVPPQRWSEADAVVTLADPDYAGLLETLARHLGCFKLQLHGWMHCRPQAVARAAAADPELLEAALQVAEQGYQVLPSPLQSRWVDGSSLPAAAVRGEQARREAEAEARFFLERIPGATPVVVPPTFVWNEDVERGWADAGIKILITPGRRQETRDAAGQPHANGGHLGNGERAAGGLVVLVRDLFFEPVMGHSSEAAVAAVLACWSRGRPALVETHRFNYEGQHAAKGVAALDEFLGSLTARVEGVRFVGPEEIADCLKNPRCQAQGRTRLAIWARRLLERWRLRRTLWLSGGMLWLRLLLVIGGGWRGGRGMR